MYNPKIDKVSEFKALFGIELSEVKNERVKSLWNCFDEYVNMIDDGEQWKRACARNNGIVEEIRAILN